MTLILSGTNGLSDVDGTAATPAIRGTDANTGIFFPAADTIAFSEGGVEAMRLDSAGNMGLGVTPSAWSGSLLNSGAFQLGAGYGSLYAYSNAITLGSNVYYNSNGNKYFASGTGASAYQQIGGVHYWLNSPSGTAGNAISFTQAMTLDASGNLLVGQTSNPAVGRVAVTFAGNTTNGLELKDSTDTTSAAYIAFRNAAGSATGSVTRGSGNTVVYNVTSDYRLKTVIGPVTDAGQRIDALQPIEYTWNTDASRTRGFLAHQFQEVYAASVTGSKDAVDAEGKPVYQQMQPSTPEVIADLVAELQSLRARVAQLEAK